MVSYGGLYERLKMGYQEYEIPDTIDTLPLQGGFMTIEMWFSLTGFLLALAGVIYLLIRARKKHIAAKNRNDNASSYGCKRITQEDGGDILEGATNDIPQPEREVGARRFLATALITALSFGVVFIADGLSPDQDKLTAAHEKVEDNYRNLFSEYGLKAPENVTNLKVGDSVETTLKSKPQQKAIVRIQVIEGEVVLTTFNGDKQLPESN